MFDIKAAVDLASAVRELSRMNDLLARLVNACERLAPSPLPVDVPVEMATLGDLHTIDDQAAQQVSLGKRAIALSFGVVPDSEAFDIALEQYDREMKKVYGEDHKTDWEDVFRRAAQTQAGIGN